MNSFNRLRLPAIAGLVAALAGEPLVAAEEGTVLPERPLLDDIAAHARPRPYPIPRPFADGEAPVFNPHRQDRLPLDTGAAASVAESQRAFRLGGGYGGAGDAWEAAGLGTLALDAGMLRAAVARRAINEYRDGDGRTTRFGYDRDTAQLGLAWFPAAGRELRASLLYDDIDDLALPLAIPTVRSGVPLIVGTGADPLKTQRSAARVAYDDASGAAGTARFHLEGGVVALERRADNFTLRPTPAPSRMRNQMSGDVWDAAGWADFARGWGAFRLGADARGERFDGVRRGGPNVNNLAQVTGFQVPGFDATRFGAFGEAAAAPWAGATLSGALRWETRHARIGRADQAFALPGFAGTPRTLYAGYYGAGLDLAPRHSAPSAKLELKQAVGPGTEAHVAIARQARFPEFFELFFALPSSPPTNVPAGTPSRQVGNPGLETEMHHRLEAGVVATGADWVDWRRVRGSVAERFAARAWRASFTAYVDRVDDFASRDRARAQAGVLRADNATIWRNVDALLAGAEADLQWNLTRNFSLRANFWWSWGENTSEDRPLYGIAPLEGTLVADWHDRLGTVGTWNAGAKLRGVARKSRADDDPALGSGYDPVDVHGYGLLDLYAALQFSDRVAVSVGLDNVLDRTYADFNAFTTTDETARLLANGPGRFAWVRVVANF
ncbi:MAG: TonB-dependent receptor [Burkholderiales bacterium]|nr:TonB-dependent receptor [Burkholderiales bacterium]